MRKIIGSLFQSLDGVIQAPGGPEEDQTGFAQGAGISAIAKATGLSRQTVYRIEENPAAAARALSSWGL